MSAPLFRMLTNISASFPSVKLLSPSNFSKYVCSGNILSERRMSQSNKHSKDPHQKYKFAKLSAEVDLPTHEVCPKGIFANNELDLSTISVYGFDYDYTLAVYKESLHYLIHNLGRDWLIDKFKYPAEIRKLEYLPEFAIRGLHYDNLKGVLMKIDSFHQIQFESVYRGMTPLTKEQIISDFGGSYIPQEMIRGSSAGGSARMKQLNDLFSVPEICLISSVTEFFEKNGMTYHPEILSHDIQHAIQSIHPVMHKMLDENKIGEYLEKHPGTAAFLRRLKDAGKKMFLITNSPFKFVDIGMKYMIGSDWIDYFDVIVVQARKPKFFTEKSRPFRIYDVTNDSQQWTRVTKLEKGCIYLEGNLLEFQNLTGWHGHSVLYFGDQIYSDLADLTLHHGWRTGAIIHELAREIQILNSEKYRHDVAWLHALQKLIEELQLSDGGSEIIKDLLKERDELRIHTKSMFNQRFGSIFRTHHNPTYFSRRLFRYSDIYMSHITNLMNFSPNHIFYPKRSALPHESRATAT